MIFLSSITLLEGIACAIALQLFILLWFLKNKHQQKTLSEQLNEKMQQTLTTQLHQLHLDLIKPIKTANTY